MTEQLFTVRREKKENEKERTELLFTAKGKKKGSGKDKRL